MYTQEQLDIALLKNTNEGVLRTLSDIKSDLISIRSEIKSQSHFNIGLTLGIYAILGTVVLAKFFGVSL